MNKYWIWRRHGGGARVLEWALFRNGTHVNDDIEVVAQFGIWVGQDKPEGAKSLGPVWVLK